MFINKTILTQFIHYFNLTIVYLNVVLYFVIFFLSKHVFTKKYEMDIELEEELKGHLERVWCVRWHPNGKWLASCGADRNIRIWQKEGLFGFFFNNLILLF